MGLFSTKTKNKTTNNQTNNNSAETQTIGGDNTGAVVNGDGNTVTTTDHGAIDAGVAIANEALLNQSAAMTDLTNLAERITSDGVILAQDSMQTAVETSNLIAGVAGDSLALVGDVSNQLMIDADANRNFALGVVDGSNTLAGDAIAAAYDDTAANRSFLGDIANLLTGESAANRDFMTNANDALVNSTSESMQTVSSIAGDALSLNGDLLSESLSANTGLASEFVSSHTDLVSQSLAFGESVTSNALATNSAALSDALSSNEGVSNNAINAISNAMSDVVGVVTSLGEAQERSTDAALEVASNVAMDDSSEVAQKQTLYIAAAFAIAAIAFSMRGS